jgi:putative ABC transport system permease protein
MRADLVLETPMVMPFGPETAAAVSELPGVETAASLKMATADVSSPGRIEEQKDARVVAMEPDEVPAVFDLPMTEGSVEALAPGRLLVSEKSGLTVGDTVIVAMEGGEDVLLSVAGVFRAAALGDYLISTPQLLEIAPKASDFQVFVAGEQGVTTAELEETVDTFLLDTFPLVEAKTGAEFSESRQGMIGEAVNMVSVLLVLSLLIALLGVANTLSLSIIERTREVGMLRAIGMARRQLRSMVRVEAMLMAAYGALVGVAVGLSLGWVLSTVILDGWDVAITIPTGRLAAFVGLTLAAAVVAAMLPARRAARMSVLDAVSAA